MAQIRKQPILSICIPTFNRIEYLVKSIESIISSEGFNKDDVEIVISDNASTDETQKTMLEYSEKYSNIKYYRNEENIRDRNFPKVISEATGIYRKLCNDTLLFKKDSIRKMIDIIRSNTEEKPVIFFDNKGNEILHVTSLEAFLYRVSFNITWIGGFGVWEDFCDGMAESIEGCDELLWQVSFLLRYIDSKKNALIVEEPYFVTQSVSRKDISYGLYTVFYVNYLGFIRKYLEAGTISQSCYDFLEKDLLFNFFPLWMYNWQRQNNSFEYSKEENLVASIMNAYNGKPYYNKFRRFYRFFRIKMTVKNILKIFYMRYFYRRTL
ncbi:MAG: glycosyltransferase [Bacteroides sp.]|nr:glycosyltransferase [Prevotella sp.]MCM1408562.1 glycosyltransferase [Treponema brennaborense]MCM1470724.1 glycosyltransferase [Bacteroides sp.]